MKVLLLFDYPPPPGGLATQGELLLRGLLELGVDARAAHLDSALEKEWYYGWFKPDAVVGIGYWGMTPQLVLHAQKHGVLAIPWLVANGYVVNYRETLSNLPLMLVTSQWVKDVYLRDGISGANIEVLPVGCDTDSFIPYPKSDPRVIAARAALGVREDQLLILTVGGDAASKGGREVMRALAQLGDQVPDYRYVCKVWAQARTQKQNALDSGLAEELGIQRRVSFCDGRVSRQFMPFLISACDVYAAPSRLEGFGMGQVEAGACGKPVIGIRAMAMLETLSHGQTALLASVATENVATGAVVGPEAGFEPGHRIEFPNPRVVDYRASVPELAEHLHSLLNDPALCRRLGQAGRERALEYDYRKVAWRFLEIVERKLGLSGP
ncbi:MAG TPA: glycosyltransferase family 4 protein [Polyangiaceae bacterium]|nr:glycosyltransferase family 4 protein [Polyangiaceae bacterium]